MLLLDCRSSAPQSITERLSISLEKESQNIRAWLLRLNWPPNYQVAADESNHAVEV